MTLNPRIVDPSSLPSLPLDDKQKLPSIRGIYFVIDVGRNVQYIGCTADLRSRWQGHHRIKELKVFPDIKIAWLEIAKTDSLVKTEKDFIEHFAPLLNKKLR